MSLSYLPANARVVSSLSKKNIPYDQILKVGFLQNHLEGLTFKNNKSFLISQLSINAPEALQLQADRQSYNAIKRIFVAEGRVKVSLNGAILKADRIEFDRKFRTLYAFGRVRFKKGSQYFQASSFRYNLIQKTGELKDVYGVIELDLIENELNLIPKRNNSKKQIGIPKEISDRDNDFIVDNLDPIQNEPISIWSGTNSPTGSSKQSISYEEDDYSLACPPLLPPIPVRHPYAWSFTSWGGLMTDAALSEALIFSGSNREEIIFGLGINKRIYRTGPVHLEIEADWFTHQAEKQLGGAFQEDSFSVIESQNFGEGVFGIVARLWLRPWLNVGLVEGISYTTSLSEYERTNREDNSKLLNYLGFEIEALLSERISIVGRIHHRSGAFGLFNGVKEGSNAYLIGFRYHWGEENLRKAKNVLRPPAGCPESNSDSIESTKTIDDNLEVSSLRYIEPYSNSKLLRSYQNKFNHNSSYLKRVLSRLSDRDKDELRRKSIKLIDQRINSIKLKDRFSLQGRFGIPTPSNNLDERRSNNRFKVNQLNTISQAKFIAGSITRWRVQAGKLVINPDGWEADNMGFTNDPFTPTQTRIEAINVQAKEDDKGDYIIKARRSRLIIEERISLPIIKSKRISRSEKVENRWVFGIDIKDRDGLFIGRAMKPILLGDKYTLALQPQFLLQRAIMNETNSYIEPGSSVISGNVTNTPSLSDLFALKGKLRGELMDFDLKLDANISTFNQQRFFDGSRYWGNLSKELSVPWLNSLTTSIFGAYRYKARNGSLGETDIYTAYGGFLEKKGSWNLGKLNNNYVSRLGLGNYQSESLAGGSLMELWRANAYGSIETQYPLWEGPVSNLSPNELYRYSPIPINPGLTFNTNLNAAYFLYENGRRQKTITMSAGPELTLGNFTKQFFDYTKVSLSAGSTFKQGSSPFAFDEAVDLLTLGVGFTQQIFGPLILNTGFEFNIDRDSKYFGRPINSNIEFVWSRRSYDIGLFYNPDKGLGGLRFRLNDFKFDGTGIPFVPFKSNQYRRDIVGG